MLAELMSIIKDISQVLFWIVVSVVSVLTYLRARKTILQPLRTEVFKMQLEQMRKILGTFVGKDEIELRRSYGFDKLMVANAVKMYDAYAETFFDAEVIEEKRPYGPRECPGAIMRTEAFLKHFEPANGHIEVQPAKKDGFAPRDPRTRAALWATYSHDEVRIPREFYDMDRQVQEFLESPLLPPQCVRVLGEYKEAAQSNLRRLAALLTECAKEMPRKYASADELTKASLGWINDRFTREFEHLKPKADAIVAFVRSCYDVDNLLRV